MKIMMKNAAGLVWLAVVCMLFSGLALADHGAVDSSRAAVDASGFLSGLSRPSQFAFCLLNKYGEANIRLGSQDTMTDPHSGDIYAVLGDEFGGSVIAAFRQEKEQLTCMMYSCISKPVFSVFGHQGTDLYRPLPSDPVRFFSGGYSIRSESADRKDRKRLIPNNGKMWRHLRLVRWDPRHPDRPIVEKIWTLFEERKFCNSHMNPTLTPDMTLLAAKQIRKETGEGVFRIWNVRKLLSLARTSIQKQSYEVDPEHLDEVKTRLDYQKSLYAPGLFSYSVRRLEKKYNITESYVVVNAAEAFEREAIDPYSSDPRFHKSQGSAWQSLAFDGRYFYGLHSGGGRKPHILSVFDVDGRPILQRESLEGTVERPDQYHFEGESLFFDRRRESMTLMMTVNIADKTWLRDRGAYAYVLASER
ncbi:MAG: hypothetical protein PUB69_00125 [Desulfovibrionaceae bacterium]|nr:hypothetical protein [Desulfovibrionaceae bacterium]